MIIAGVGVAAMVAVVCLIILVALLIARRRRKKRNETELIIGNNVHGLDGGPPSRPPRKCDNSMPNQKGEAGPWGVIYDENVGKLGTLNQNVGNKKTCPLD